MDTGSMLAGCCRPVLREAQGMEAKRPSRRSRDQMGGTLSIKQSHSWASQKPGALLEPSPGGCTDFPAEWAMTEL